MGVTECMRTVGFRTTEDKREQRDKIFCENFLRTARSTFPQLEKTLKDVGAPSGEYAMGEKITMVDVNCVFIKLMYSCHELNKMSNGAFKALMSELAPTVLTIADGAMKNVAI